MSEVSVYIHVPFCLKKCSYCDFYSTNALSVLPAYVSSLQREIEGRTSLSGTPGKAPKKTGTIYFGGGTPSLLPLESVEKILETIYARYQVSQNAEITVEVNPGTVDEPYLAGLKSLGVNRLSIGVQSFDAHKIKVLGRIHTIEQSIEAIGVAKSVGFENIGLDLIYGTPGETREEWIKDLKMALKFKVAHLSCYMLTLESGTPLQAQYKKGLFQLPGPDMLTNLFMATAIFLEQHGYEHYEISNFARGKQNRSRHNSNYWQMIPYDGFGPSAHSFDLLSSKDQDAQNRDARNKDAQGRNIMKSSCLSLVRSWNIADVNAYITSFDGSAGGGVREQEVLSLPQQMLERVMLGLRTSDGFDLTEFEQLMGPRFLQKIVPLMARLEAQELGRVTPGTGKRFVLTLSGRARLDNIVEAFADIIL